jgi:hypothetical protein
MACLSDLLSFNICSSSLVTSLAGVDAAMFNNLQKSDESDVQTLFNDVNSEAERLFNDEFSKIFHSFFNFHQESASVGSLIKPVQFVPVYAGKQGILIEKPESNFAKIHIKALSFWSQLTTSVTVEFWDADMSILLASQAVILTGGRNRIAINMTFDTDNLFICYDGSISKLFKTSDSVDNCNVCSCNENVLGAKTNTTPEASTLSLGSEMYGLGIDFSIGCEIQDLICFYQTELLNTYLYAFGAALKQEQLQTKKSNKWTMLKPDEISKSYDMYANKLRESLESFIKNMKIPDGFCATCKPFSTITYGL